MDIATWIIGLLTAAAFLFAGTTKTVLPKRRLAAMGMAYVEDFRDGQIKLIGIAELLGAAGIVLGLVFRSSFAVSGLWLAFAAAVALAILMVGAVVAHRRRKETVLPPMVPGALAVVTAILTGIGATS